LGGEHAIPTFSKLVVPNIGLRPVFWEVSQLGTVAKNLEITMSDNILKKIIVTAVALIGLAMWAMLGHVEQSECLNNCPTDFSASSR
jgi:hypothetical protein